MGNIVDGLIEAIENFIGEIFYGVEILFCLILSWLQSLFNVFSGISEAEYNGEPEYLVNVFFNNKTVQNIYWGMAAIGIVLIFVFAIMAVVKKSFDLDDKVKQSYGQIIRNVLRSTLIIISMNLIVTVSITFTNYLMDSVNEIFDNADTLVGDDPHIEFTDEQFATMSRIFNTVGNYSLNPSYKNRYNINACFNEIRGDLALLESSGVFNYYYNDVDEDGNKIDTWQSVLQEIYNSADIDQELASDTYNDRVARSLDHCMTVLNTSTSTTFRPHESYDKQKFYVDQDVPLDRILFLIGTMGMGSTTAAKNPAYDKNPSLFDNLRGPYYSGQKDMYDIDTVEEDFNLWILRMNYIVVYFAAMLLVKSMAIIAVNCIVRIFNLLFLYLVAPPIIAASPLDDGGKYKQWLTAFIIQLFSVFATVISMRVFLVYVPIVINPDFKLVSTGFLHEIVDMVGKVIMIWAGTEAVEKANGLLTGILADMAGHQSLLAGDMSNAVKGSALGQAAAAARSKFEGAVTSAALTPVKAGLAVAKTAGRVAALPFRPLVGAVSNAGKWVDHGLSSAESYMDNSILSSPDKHAKDQQANQEAYNKAHPNGENPMKDLKAPEIPMGGLNPGGGNNGNLPDMNNALGDNGNLPEMPDNQGGGNNNNNNNNNNANDNGQMPDNQNNLGNQQQDLGGGGGGDNNNGGGDDNNNPPDMPQNQNDIGNMQQDPQGGGGLQGGGGPQGGDDQQGGDGNNQMPGNQGNIGNDQQMPGGFGNNGPVGGGNNNNNNMPGGNNNLGGGGNNNNLGGGGMQGNNNPANRNNNQRPLRQPPPQRNQNERNRNLFGVNMNNAQIQQYQQNLGMRNGQRINNNNNLPNNNNMRGNNNNNVNRPMDGNNNNVNRPMNGNNMNANRQMNNNNVNANQPMNNNNMNFNRPMNNNNNNNNNNNPPPNQFGNFRNN